MIVVDSSVVFDFLVHRNGSDQVTARFIEEGFAFHAPGILTIELVSILRNHQRGRGPDPEDEEIFADFLTFPVTIHPHLPLLPRIWQLRHNITPYDASYVALAELLNIPLLTRDRKLAHSSGHRARIEVI